MTSDEATPTCTSIASATGRALARRKLDKLYKNRPLAAGVKHRPKP